MKVMLPVIVVWVFGMSLQAQRDVGTLGDGARAAFLGYLSEAGRPPVDYIVHCFEKHDLVLLGEVHQIRENCLFVADLVRPCYERAGVRVLASEFVRQRDQERVDRLVLGERWDQKLSTALLRDLPWPTWGFAEYQSILRAVWRLNHSLDASAEKMCVVGIDSDWSQVEMWRSESPSERFQLLVDREQTMVSALEEGAINPGLKAIVHLGWNHSITCQGIRCGTVLRKRYGKRVFQVALHQDFGPAMRTFLEALFAKRSGKAQGFDVVGSPFAKLRDSRSPLFRRVPRFGLSQLAEGYVFLARTSDLHKVSWIPGHIDPAHFEDARFIALKMKWIKKGECKSARDLDQRMGMLFPSPRKKAAQGMSDRERWDRRYAGSEFLYGKEASPFLKARASLLPKKGRALVLACGEGRNAVFLARSGLEVRGIDVSPLGLAKCRELASSAKVAVQTVALDLKEWNPEPKKWDLITVINFHDPSLFPKIRRALVPGGIVLLDSYSIDQRRFDGGPRNPAFLIAPGELLTAFEGFRVLVYEDLVVAGRSARIRLIARKP